MLQFVMSSFLQASKVFNLAIVFIFLPMLLKLNIYFLLGIILILLLIYIDYIIFLEMGKIKNNVKPSNNGFIFGFNIVRVGAETGI